MVNGLRVYRKYPFASLLNDMLGLSEDPLRNDAAAVVIRCHLIFKMVQGDWLKLMKENYTEIYSKVKKEDISNLNNGGYCSIFEIYNALQMAFDASQKEYMHKLMLAFKPDKLIEKGATEEEKIEFLILKVTNRISKLGKDIKWVFDAFDTDHSGHCKSTYPFPN